MLAIITTAIFAVAYIIRTIIIMWNAAPDDGKQEEISFFCDPTNPSDCIKREEEELTAYNWEKTEQESITWKNYEGNRIYMPGNLKEDYMNSPEWKKLKRTRSVIAEGMCECDGCSETKSLVLHHLRYNTLGLGGTEELNDVRIVCSNHHNEIHKDGESISRTDEHPLPEKVKTPTRKELEDMLTFI